MKQNTKTPHKSIAQQIACLKIKYPHYAIRFMSPSSMMVKGAIKPTARSLSYTFVMKYALSSPPKIKVISPQLEKNSKGEKIPHLYSDGNLCLYRPKYMEFSSMYFIADTIIPWTSLWLYYYELWHITGEWLGGGEHPSL